MKCSAKKVLPSIKYAVLPTMFVMFLVCSFAGCQYEVSDADIDKQVETIEQEEEKLAAMKERQKFESDMEAKLDELRNQIKNLNKKAESADGEKEVQLRGEVAELKTRCEQMQTQLDELKAASGDMWAQSKIKAEAAWNDLSESVESKISQWKADMEQSEDKSKSDSEGE
ncbi:MAG: hypothetical protein AAF939_06595 [Planctomycetota bacterium]